MKPEGRRFWLWWVLAGTVGWGAAGPIGVSVGRSENIIVSGALGLALGGFLAAILQWLLLRWHFTRAGRWVAAGPVAAAGGLAIGFGVGATAGVDAGWIAGAVSFLIGIVVLQWLVLRRHVARAGWWVPAGIAGWIVGGPVIGLAGAITGVVAGQVAGWALLGAGQGAVTGPVLARLLGRRR